MSVIATSPFVRYEAGRFIGAAKSLAGQGCCSRCQSSGVEWMRNQGAAWLAYCTRCRQELEATPAQRRVLDALRKGARVWKPHEGRMAWVIYDGRPPRYQTVRESTLEAMEAAKLVVREDKLVGDGGCNTPGDSEWRLPEPGEGGA